MISLRAALASITKECLFHQICFLILFAVSSTWRADFFTHWMPAPTYFQPVYPLRLHLATPTRKHSSYLYVCSMCCVFSLPPSLCCYVLRTMFHMLKYFQLLICVLFVMVYVCCISVVILYIYIYRCVYYLVYVCALFLLWLYFLSLLLVVRVLPFCVCFSMLVLVLTFVCCVFVLI